ncbi:serine hydrolase domain-containing protein [Caulobacter sp. 17J65-9]|uniref:serine hydrolase domain-containing protein n=1 Tax=Caulobacter sp. 17J65-9 TaxID=2709382 RepID=UPI0013C770C9|nr:serine hydrolase domain-containing protein [Caulobacter sp. 17J65-9]NEX93210.1 beta-lactamase family protein [Caulobacter sp. 17J65-9]
MKLLLCALAALAIPPAAHAGTPQAAAPRTVEVLDGPVAAAIDAQLTAAAEQRGFGGAVVVEMEGRTVLKAGYGYADREAKTPFTADTTAQIGSITKTFTALAASQLAAEGKLDLHVPVRAWLPGAAEPAAAATLNQLMTHTAGLDDYCGDDFEPRTRAELLTRCMALPLKQPPGRSLYSNLGLSITAATVEQASGQDWVSYLRTHVWAPFGMTRTGWTFPGAPRAGFAIGYLNDKAQPLISDQIAALHGADWNLKGNGGLQASAADMQRFYHGLMAQPEAVRALVLSPHAPGETPDVREGYGLFFRVDDQGRTLRAGHGGSDGTFFSYLALFPGRDAFFYFAGNNGETPARDELKGVLKTVQDALPPVR